MRPVQAAAGSAVTPGGEARLRLSVAFNFGACDPVDVTMYVQEDGRNCNGHRLHLHRSSCSK